MAERRFGATVFRRGTSGGQTAKKPLKPWQGHETGLVLALDARFGIEPVREGDDLVSRWVDQSPANNHQVPSGPTRIPHKSVNGNRPSVRFGAGTGLTTQVPSTFPGGREATVMIVADVPHDRRECLFETGIVSFPARGMRLDAGDRGGQFRFRVRDHTGLLFTAVHTSVGYPTGTHMVTGFNDPTTRSIYVNGVEDGRDTGGVEIGLSHEWKWWIGHAHDFTFALNGHIHTILAWSRDLPAAELDIMHNRVKRAWRLN